MSNVSDAMDELDIPDLKLNPIGNVTRNQVQARTNRLRAICARNPNDSPEVIEYRRRVRDKLRNARRKRRDAVRKAQRSGSPRVRRPERLVDILPVQSSANVGRAMRAIRNGEEAKFRTRPVMSGFGENITTENRSGKRAVGTMIFIGIASIILFNVLKS